MTSRRRALAWPLRTGLAFALATACTAPAVQPPPTAAAPARASADRRAAADAVWRELNTYRPDFGPRDPAYFDTDILQTGPGTATVLAAMGQRGVDGLVQLLHDRDTVFERLGTVHFAAVVEAMHCRAAVAPLLGPQPDAAVRWQEFALAAQRELGAAPPREVRR